VRPQRVRRAFDAAAQSYDDHAVIQRIVARRLAERIAALPLPERPRILEIGCGTGFLSAALRERLGPADWTLTDLSPAMLAACRARLGAPDGVEFRVMDGERPDLDQSFDLICSSLSFQWFEDLQGALGRLGGRLAPGGWLAFATLADGTLAEWRATHEAMGLRSGGPDYPSTDDLSRLAPAPLGGRVEDERLVQVHAGGLAFVQGLKAIGAGCAPEGRRPLLPAELKRVISAFEAAGSAATYHIAYGAWRKPSARPAGVFVTGADTGVGKTVVSACLAKAWGADYWKPVQTGLADEAGDTRTVADLAGLGPERLHAPAYAFDPPVSPHLAAAAAGTRIGLEDFRLPTSDRPIVVEGAGGALVPLNESASMLDLIARLGLPVVVVAADRLGAINHTLLTLETLRARGLQVLGVVLTGGPFGDNRAAIERHGRVRILAELPTAERLDAARIAAWSEQIPRLEQLLG
jgi:malonyl-ACP O-methyltransferase BioC/dethiobiotin synthase